MHTRSLVCWLLVSTSKCDILTHHLTCLEIVLARHGKLAHKIYTVFGLITNVINGSALLTGGCGVFNALTGMNIWASYFILIIVVQVWL
jgi:Na+/proline symporter